MTTLDLGKPSANCRQERSQCMSSSGRPSKCGTAITHRSRPAERCWACGTLKGGFTISMRRPSSNRLRSAGPAERTL